MVFHIFLTAQIELGDTSGRTSLTVGRRLFVVSVPIVVAGASAGLHIVLQAKEFVVMMMGQDRCRQHHYADNH